MELEIKNINWPDLFSECPETHVSVGHNADTLNVRFHVKGRQLRAMALEDGETVSEDSCVEFFCRIPGSDYYINFEANCIGTMVAKRRKGRKEDVSKLTDEEMKSIRRVCSLGHERIEEMDGDFEWETEIQIPFKLLLGNKKATFPMELECNFYKCGDKTRYPHYVSWQPINLPKPDFHCPQFFGKIILE